METINAGLSTVVPTPDQLGAISRANRWIYDVAPEAHAGYGDSIRLVYVVEGEPALRLTIGQFGEYVDLHMWDNEEMPYSTENYDSDWVSIDGGQLSVDIMDAILYD
jgi:hypothetical protein